MPQSKYTYRFMENKRRNYAISRVPVTYTYHRWAWEKKYKEILSFSLPSYFNNKEKHSVSYMLRMERWRERMNFLTRIFDIFRVGNGKKRKKEVLVYLSIEQQ